MAKLESKKRCMLIDISTFASLVELEDDRSTIEDTEITRELLKVNHDKYYRRENVKSMSLHKKNGDVLVIHYILDTELVLNTFVENSIKPCNCKKGNFIHSFHGAIIISKYKDKKQVDITMEDVYNILSP